MLHVFCLNNLSTIVIKTNIMEHFDCKRDGLSLILIWKMIYFQSSILVTTQDTMYRKLEWKVRNLDISVIQPPPPRPPPRPPPLLDDMRDTFFDIHKSE